MSDFLSENFHFLVIKFLVYLNRHVFQNGFTGACSKGVGLYSEGFFRVSNKPTLKFFFYLMYLVFPGATFIDFIFILELFKGTGYTW